jgi:glycosyltransferase involved in cell wall biosynthesis
MPFFSIIVPMYNRALLIGRALESCLAQDFQDFEIVIVDDGSTDESVKVVQRYCDPRIRLIVHEGNKGQCTAKNTGSQAATGEWLIFLDSDDEFLQGALNIVHGAIFEQEQSIEKLLFMCRWSNGTFSPDPPLEGQAWDYEGFIGWLESMIGRPIECLLCVRRTSFAQIPFPDGHAPEGRHNLDFARVFAAVGRPEVIRLYHQNSDDRLMRPSLGRLLLYSSDYASEIDKTFLDHGEALKRWAPKLQLAYQQTGALFHFLNGNRKAGLRYILSFLVKNPLSLKGWAIMILGVVGRRPLALMKTSYDMMIQRRIFLSRNSV